MADGRHTGPPTAPAPPTARGTSPRPRPTVNVRGPSVRTARRQHTDPVRGPGRPSSRGARQLYRPPAGARVWSAGTASRQHAGPFAAWAPEGAGPVRRPWPTVNARGAGSRTGLPRAHGAGQPERPLAGIRCPSVAPARERTSATASRHPGCPRPIALAHGPRASLARSGTTRLAHTQPSPAPPKHHTHSRYPAPKQRTPTVSRTPSTRTAALPPQAPPTQPSPAPSTAEQPGRLSISSGQSVSACTRPERTAVPSASKSRSFWSA